MAGKGGAWKVAYADFATAMMAFFLVMWITTQSKPVKEAVAEYFENPEGNQKGVRSTSEIGDHESLTIGNFEKGRGPGSGLVKTDLRSSAPENSQGTAARTPPRILITHAKLRYTSTGTGVIFANDSALLDDASRTRLDLLVPLLIPEKGAIEIQSFNQRRSPDPAASIQDLRDLSYARCQAVTQYLVNRGISRRRMRLCIDGSAEFQMFETNSRSMGESREHRKISTKDHNVFVFLTEIVPEKPATEGKPTETQMKPHDPHAKPNDAHAKPSNTHSTPKDSHGKPKDAHAKPKDLHAKSAHAKDSHTKPKDPHAKPTDPPGKPTDSHGKPASSQVKPETPHAAPNDDSHEEHGAKDTKPEDSHPAPQNSQPKPEESSNKH